MFHAKTVAACLEVQACLEVHGCCYLLAAIAAHTHVIHMFKVAVDAEIESKPQQLDMGSNFAAAAVC